MMGDGGNYAEIRKALLNVGLVAEAERFKAKVREFVTQLVTSGRVHRSDEGCRNCAGLAALTLISDASGGVILSALGEFVVRYLDLEDEARAGLAEFAVQHVGGVPWSSAPRPGRLHMCKPHTILRAGQRNVQICACGAFRSTLTTTRSGQVFGRWLDKNIRLVRDELGRTTEEDVP